MFKVIRGWNPLQTQKLTSLHYIKKQVFEKMKETTKESMEMWRLNFFIGIIVN